MIYYCFLEKEKETLCLVPFRYAGAKKRKGNDTNMSLKRRQADGSTFWIRFGALTCSPLYSAIRFLLFLFFAFTLFK